MYELVPLQILPGVEKSTDQTENSTRHYVDADKIRFVKGFPEKIGGWESIDFADDTTIEGCPRLLFSYNLDNVQWQLIGTHQNLYSLLASQLTNITPLKTATTAIADSLDTVYVSLGSNPISTTSGSNTVTITDTATKVRVGDTITLSGVSGAVNGIPAAELNTSLFVRSQSTNSFDVIVATAATSTGSGGGGSVILATGIVTVNQTSHGFRNGLRVKIDGATAFGGITALQINREFVIRNVTTNTYDVLTTGTATSAVTGGGGASTTVQEQIDDGLCDATTGSGYGLGLYGVGRYGVAKQATTGADLPRVWSADRFGNLVVVTPGNQGALYSWDSDIQEAPIVVTNAPTAINYVFVSNEICVTLGAAGVGNRIQWSDQGNLTVWASTSTNQAGQDDIEGAGAFISHAPVRGTNLLFTESAVYTFRYIGQPLIWETRLLDSSVGLIAQNARQAHNGVVYWMGQDNFYMYQGGRVNIIPSNSGVETTLKDFVFDDLNYGQRSKIFAWLNEEFSEIWWHYPSAASDECDRVVTFNYLENTWTPDTFDRTAGEYPRPLRQLPRLVSSDGVLFNHESGSNADGEAMAWSLKTPFVTSGTLTTDHGGFFPDSLQTGNITVDFRVKKRAQSTTLIEPGPFTVTPTTEQITSFNVNGRFWQYEISGNELNQFWRAGQWYEEIQKSTPE